MSFAITKCFQSYLRHGKRLSRSFCENKPSKILLHSLSLSRIFYLLIGDISGIRTIGINRPNRRNSLNSQTIVELRRALRDFDEDDNYNVAVLYGEGGTFCSGFDLDELVNEGYESILKSTEGMFDGPLTMKPLIASINGFAAAEGFELALACDIRVVEHTALMGALGRRFGVPMSLGGAERLSKLIGVSKALDLVITGRLLAANEANECGMIGRLVSTGAALGQSINLAVSLNKFPLEAVIHDKLEILKDLGGEKFKAYYEKNIIDLKTKAFHESRKHASKFVEGIGKHGKFNNLTQKEVTGWEAEIDLEISKTIVRT